MSKLNKKNIIQYPASILTEAVEVVDEAFIRSPEFIELVKEMRFVMKDANGVGLAANQIGVNKAIAVIDSRFILSDYNDPLSILINPEYTPYTKTLLTLPEGCLSLGEGEKSFKVKRYSQIVVHNDLLYEDGKVIRKNFTVSGYLSRICQHEIQHLYGMLCHEKRLRLGEEA